MKTIILVSVGMIPALVAQDDSDAKLNEALKKTAKVKSVEIYMVTQYEGVRDGGEQPKPIMFEAKYDSESGLMGTLGEAVDFVKVKDKLVIRDPREGAWKKPDDVKADENAMRFLKGIAERVRMAESPLDYLNEISGGLRNIKECEKEMLEGTECSVFTATVTEDAIRKISKPEGKPRPKNGPKVDSNVKIWVDGNGFVVKIEFFAKTKQKTKDGVKEVGLTRTIHYLNHDKTKFEIPEEARKLLEEK